MTGNTDLADFAEDLRVEVNQRLALEPESMNGDMFVRVVGERLMADGALEDLHVCYLRQTGRPSLEVAGYHIGQDGTVLDLVTRATDRGATTVTRSKVDQLFRRAAAFAEACRDGLHRRMEESSPAYDMAQRIHAKWQQLRKVRILLVTDGRTTLDHLDAGTVAGLPATYDVWDITRLHRLATSGRVQEEIVIDLEAMGEVVPVLKSPKQSDGYRCLLAVLPGQLLADLYEQHSGRLLQRNVRAYLQARGRVNKEIHTTLRTAPGRFLAYNNGISATATDVAVRTVDGATVLTRLHDLQIVNGGQTTASLHHAATLKADLSDVHVMAKITVVPADMLDELVPRISRYANSQNAIRPADFEANSAFHVGLERVSRAVWAPAVGGATRQTRWYYERVRGQYQVERSRLRGRGQLGRFEQEHPPAQRFGKTDAAKYEMAYLRQPHTVSLGAEKCFHEWTLQCHLDERDEPSVQYFQHLIAKGILFQRIRSRVLGMKLGGYPGQTAAYVMALILERLGGGIDLDLVWRLQSLPSSVAAVIPSVTEFVRQVIIDPPDSANITEWCKKEACWHSVQQVAWQPPPDLAGLAMASIGTNGQ